MNIKQLTANGDKFYDSAKVILINQLNRELVNTSGNFEITEPLEVVPEKFRFDGSKKNRKKRIENSIKQFKISLEMKEKFIRLAEKYKYESTKNGGFVYQDWADYGHYFLNYSTSYLLFLECILFLDNTALEFQQMNPGPYEKKRIEARKILSEMKEYQWRMQEIEKRFQERLDEPLISHN